MKNLGIVIISGITFVLFFVEALLHYNIGHSSADYIFPTRDELVRIVAILLAFSLLNGFVSKMVINWMHA